MGKRGLIWVIDDNRAQMFILAAVILSVLIIGFGVVYNYAKTSKEPKNFYDVTYDVKRESGEVIDYEIYNNISDKIKLVNFVNSLADYIRDKNPGANFIFIYGNSDNITLWNYGVDDAAYNAGGDSGHVIGSGKEVVSSVSYVPAGGGVRTRVPVVEKIQDYSQGWRKTLPKLNESEPIAIVIGEKDYEFKVTKERQVITIIQKAGANESYVSMK